MRCSSMASTVDRKRASCPVDFYFCVSVACVCVRLGASKSSRAAEQSSTVSGVQKHNKTPTIQSDASNACNCSQRKLNAQNKK
mmetsp:Transcript_35558/g.89338  ORF Transcript_35558/g.89338 Transcript_35558/m.89338 type:complete len:83 (+) Transcript_35558:1025-1273(+)